MKVTQEFFNSMIKGDIALKDTEIIFDKVSFSEIESGEVEICI